MPRYKCATTTNGETQWQDIRADSAKEAAERFASIRDAKNCEYPEESAVMVMDSAGVVGFYRVEMYARPEYQARPMAARDLKLYTE